MKRSLYWQQKPDDRKDSFDRHSLGSTWDPRITRKMKIIGHNEMVAFSGIKAICCTVHVHPTNGLRSSLDFMSEYFLELPLMFRTFDGYYNLLWYKLLLIESRSDLPGKQTVPRKRSRCLRIIICLRKRMCLFNSFDHNARRQNK
ncbi:unnamed protein product [Colias eurytheme]|nr:unnamed protein product [Colias eurytheme]